MLDQNYVLFEQQLKILFHQYDEKQIQFVSNVPPGII